MSSLTSELENLNKTEIVRAGAGAGKTTRLVGQVFEFVENFKKQKDFLPKLVVCTFTRKATQELKERLTLKAFEKEDRELLNFVSSSSQLMISTIHGVLYQFLTRYGHLMGYDNDFHLMSDAESKNLAAKVLNEMLKEDPTLLAHQNYEFSRSLDLLLDYYKQSYFVSASPAGKADMDKVIIQQAEVWSERVHNFVQSIRSQTDHEKWTAYADKLEALKPCFRVSSPLDLDFKINIENALLNLGRKPSQRKDNPVVAVELSEEISQCIKEIKSEISSSHWQIDQFANLEQEYLFFKKYADLFSRKFYEEKSRNGWLELEDLEIFVLKAIHEDPQIVQLFSEDWDYWLIDEFQDTSPRQVEILKHFVGRKPSFFVGDPQQSIYLFRGAREKVFVEKQEEIQKKDQGEVHSLQKNYRSNPELLLFFNKVFSHIGGQFIAMEPKSEPQFKQDPVAFIGVFEGDKKNKEDYPEYEFLSSRLRQIIDQGCPLNEICILGRTNKELTNISQYLKSKGFPLHVHVSSGFYNRREIKDLGLLLKFLLNPHDDLNFLSLLRSPFVETTDKDIMDFVEPYAKKSLWKVFQEQIDQSRVIEKLQLWQKKAFEQGLSSTLVEIIRESGFLDISVSFDATGRRESNIWKYVTRLIEEESKPGFSYFDFVDRQLSAVDLEENLESDATASLSPDSINLMTIHGSKGLQFDHVFVSSLHKGPKLTTFNDFSFSEESQVWTIPIYNGESKSFLRSILDKDQVKGSKAKELAEAQRLFYVALTRAKKTVNLSFLRNCVEKNSLAQQLEEISWLKLTEGVHDEEGFTYQVCEQKPVGQSMIFKESSFMGELLPYKVVNKKTLNHKYSVTKLLEQESSSQEFSFKPKDLQEHLFKPSLGVLIHTLMERLKYSDPEEARAWIPQQTQKHQHELNVSLDYITQENEPPLMEIIKNGFVEWGFQLKRDDGILEGQIDLWGVSHTQGERKVWIVDYKSGSEKYQEKAFKQLEIYAEAVKEMGYRQNINLAVVYPLSGRSYIRTLEA